MATTGGPQARVELGQTLTRATGNWVALGTALGRLLLTVSDYQLVGLAAIPFGLVSADLVCLSRPRAGEVPAAGEAQ